MLNSLTKQVISWAEDRNLIKGSDSKTQMIKLVSEMGELADNIGKGANSNKIADDIGDCLVVLTIIAEQHNLSLEGCLAVAYEDIKDRKGIMYEGVFVKDTDPVYDEVVEKLKTAKMRIKLKTKCQ